MKHHNEIIKSIKDIFLETSKVIITDEEMNNVVMNHEYLWKEMYNVYHGMNTFQITDEVIFLNRNSY